MKTIINKVIEHRKYIIGVTIILLAIYIIYAENKMNNLNQELIGTTQAYETAIKMTELESLVEELELNRVDRIETQKQIDKLVEQKKAKGVRADEIQKKIREKTGLDM